MILTIAGANFSGANIGTNTSVGISYNGRVTGKPTSIEKNKALTSTITIKTGYTYDSISSVTVGGSAITGYTATDNGDNTVTLTIPANLITGKVVINVNTTATSTGGGEVVDPEEPGTGGGSVEDETGITWYIDNAAQANKNFNYTTTFPGAALIAEDKVEALRNVPINVIKFMPSGKPSSGITGKFAFVKLTQGTKPSESDIYYIDIPVEDMYETAPSNDAVARTYILNTPITLNENEYLVMNYVGGTGRTAGFWVNAGGQPDYKVGTYDRTNLKTENWGFPFSIGYKS